MKRLIGLLVLFFLPTALLAQSPQAATGGQATLWAGGELSIFNPDWGCKNNLPFACSDELIGPTAYFDFDWNKKWSAEGDARWLIWHGSQGQKQSSYLIGPRYRLWQSGGQRLGLYGRFEFGGVWLQTPGYPQAGSLKGSYFAIAPGADVDYRLSDHISVRADYEYEFLPSFSAGQTFNSSGQIINHSGGLSPMGVSFGVAWRVLGQ